MAKGWNGKNKEVSSKSMPMAGAKDRFAAMIGGKSNQKSPPNMKKSKGKK